MSLDPLDPEEVREWLKDPRCPDGYRVGATIEGLAVEFVKALAKNELHPDFEPGISCDCYICEWTKAARLIAAPLQGGETDGEVQEEAGGD